MSFPFHLAPAAAILGATLACAATSLAGPAPPSEVYKCAGDNGNPVYQEMPCAPGKELRNFQKDPPLITVLPAPPRSSAPAATKDAPVAASKSPGDAKAAGEAKSGKSGQAGDAGERRLIRTGMTEAEVRSKLGTPDMTTGRPSEGSVRWTYMPAPGDPDTITSVTLVKGYVADVERKALRK